MVTLTILCDIPSGKGKPYALKNDKVILISDYDNVLIVEKKGNRFPVSKDKVKY